MVYYTTIEQTNKQTNPSDYTTLSLQNGKDIKSTGCKTNVHEKWINKKCTVFIRPGAIIIFLYFSYYMAKQTKPYAYI